MIDIEILVVSSCTGRKSVQCENPLLLPDFLDRHRLQGRERGLERLMRPAAEMYTGRQHQGMMAGIRAIRGRFGKEAIAVKIVSAGYGLIDEAAMIAPYNVTFSGMKKEAIRELSSQNNVPGDLRRAVSAERLVVFLLGRDYLTAIHPPIVPSPGQRFIFLAKGSEDRTLRAPGVTVVPAGQAEARQYGTTSMSLKGRMFELFALALVEQGPQLFQNILADNAAASFTRGVRDGLGG